MHAAVTRRVRQGIEYVTVRAVAAVVGVLPGPTARTLGDVLGLVFHAVDARHRRLARANLAAAFPHWSRREVADVTRRVFRHFGRVLVELLRARRLTSAEWRRLGRVEGGEHVRNAFARGRGVLFVTGHFGYWELHALAHAVEFGPIAVVARPLDNPRLHALLEQIRTATGNEVIYRHRGVRRILRTLHQNQGVAILIDQHIQAPDGILVDFFGRPASTTAAVAELALRTGAVVIPVFALPLPGGRYRFVYEPPVEPPADEAPDAIREFTQRCTDVLEMYVRRYPQYWLWMHRRWRTPGTTGRGMFPHAGPDGPDADDLT